MWQSWSCRHVLVEETFPFRLWYPGALGRVEGVQGFRELTNGDKTHSEAFAAEHAPPAVEEVSMKEFPPFRLDLGNQCLWRRAETADAERIRLTPKAFAVLQYLVEHAGRLVTHDELIEAVWRD